jgi:hypothetical protein
VEVRLLDPLGFLCITAEQALDVRAHALVDQRKEASRGGVQAVVEIEDPISYMSEASVHERLAPSAIMALSKLKGIINHKNIWEAVCFQRLGGEHK